MMLNLVREPSCNVNVQLRMQTTFLNQLILGLRTTHYFAMRLLAPLICVLGLGEAGLIHARGLLAAGARVGVASRRGIAPPFADRAYDNYEDALADEDVSGVVIATPYNTHPELVSKAANAGKHILVEKPLGASLEEAKAAMEDAAKVRTTTGFMRRWDAGYAAARTANIGKPLVLRCLSGDAEYPAKYRRPGGASPGAMWRDLAVHDIDLARWLLRDEVEVVYARAGALVHPDIAELGDADTGVAVLGMRGGGSAVLTLSRALGYGHKVCSELVGTLGSVDVGDLKKTEATVKLEGEVKTDVRMDFRERFGLAFHRQAQGFVDLVCADDMRAEKMLASWQYPTYQDGLNATAVAEALCEAADTGMPVKLGA